MAKKLGVPWILLVHLRRPDAHGIKLAKDIRRPNIYELYGASAIENAADAVLFVHRPSVILQDARPADGAGHYEQWKWDLDRWRGRAEIVLGKRRAGKGRGFRECAFREDITWFDDIADGGSSEAEAF
jgi:replicative DNA helicase